MPPPATTNGHALPAASEEVVTADSARLLIDRLKEQMTILDQRREHHMKNKPTGTAMRRSAAEVRDIIKQRQEQMEHSSLTVKEEKAALAEMKRMKNDAQRYQEWEQELDMLKHKRAVCTDQLRLAYEQMDEVRAVAFRAEAAAALELGVDELVEFRLTVGEETQEMLSSVQWKARLKSECGVVVKMDRGPRRGVIIAGSAQSVEDAKLLI